MLFSATFKKKIERLARDALVDPVKIVQGSIGEASEDVTQIVRVVGSGGYKWNWLNSHIIDFTSQGSVLIFVTKKQNCEELAANLKSKAEIIYSSFARIKADASIIEGSAGCKVSKAKFRFCWSSIQTIWMISSYHTTLKRCIVLWIWIKWLMCISSSTNTSTHERSWHDDPVIID